MSPDRLASMANQIARFFQAQGTHAHGAGGPADAGGRAGAGGAAEAVADHLRQYWDPRMRADILAHLEAGGAGLDPVVMDALRLLRAQQTASA